MCWITPRIICPCFQATCATNYKNLGQVGGPYWDVPVGRLDSKKASLDLANSDIPTAQQGLVTLISKFWAKGLSATDMVALVGTLFSFFTKIPTQSIALCTR